MTRVLQTAEQRTSPSVPDAGSDGYFDEARTARVAEIYAPCFALILQLRAVDDFGSADALRTRIIDLLRRTERDALRAGYQREELDDVQFAIVAFIDETILSSNWQEKDQWLAKPLQLELYDRYDAGEAFFERLSALRDEPADWADVLEVYYLCMALGFKGRYLVHEQEKLRHLIEETHGHLNRVHGRRPSDLSPHGLPGDQVATEVRSKLPPWAIAVAAFALALIVYVGMSVYISRSASNTASVINEAIGATDVEHVER